MTYFSWPLLTHLQVSREALLHAEQRVRQGNQVELAYLLYAYAQIGQAIEEVRGMEYRRREDV